MGEDLRHVYHELAVSAVIDETAEASSFAFEVPTELREVFAYRAGQFLTFRIPWNGMELVRSYSLCSCPEWDEGHKVTVKRIEDGRISNWFNDRVHTGDRLSVLPPEGRFVLRDSDRPLLMFSGGSGITPVISLIKSALVTSERRIKLVYANFDRESVIFRYELEDLASRFGERFELFHHLDVDRGFLDLGGALSHARGWEDAEFYICGPEAFMDVVEESARSIGADRARIHIERFVSPVDPDRAVAPSVEPETAESPETVAFTLGGERHVLRYTPGKTLLETAIEAGLDPPFACTEGYCSTCMAKLERGTVHMRANDALSARDLEEGFILTCQGVPTSAECEVSWDEC